jgi:hypothetical protein
MCPIYAVSWNSTTTLLTPTFLGSLVCIVLSLHLLFFLTDAGSLCFTEFLLEEESWPSL